jgi:RHS repeat-associated protein
VLLSYAYDGQLMTGQTWSGGVAGSVSWTHDPDFRPVSETVTLGSSTTTARFAYDADSLLTCASSGTCAFGGTDGLRVRFDANVARPLESQVGNVSDSISYTSFGEAETYSATLSTTSALLYREQMSPSAKPRDRLGRIQRRIDTQGGVTTTWDYQYDTRGRLQQVDQNGALFERYTYDGNNNRTRIERGANNQGGETWTATVDAQDRLLTYGPFTYTYTAHGDLRTKTDARTNETTTYTFDVRGNLRRVELPNADVITYLVDGQDRRVAKQKNGTLVKAWLWRSQLQLAAELDLTNGDVTRFVYTQGSGTTPAYALRGSETWRILSDHLGTPRVVANVATGAVVVSLEVGPWGEVSTGSAGVGAIPHGFAGGLYDAETGLVRFGAREYLPIAGQWASKDPIGFQGGDVNLAAYAGRDPVNFIDPRGTSVAVAGGVAFGAAVADGPLPIGDLIGICILAAAVAYEVVVLDECLDKCAQGISGREDMCRNLSDKAARARCWNSIYDTEQVCRNFCFGEFD